MTMEEFTARVAERPDLELIRRGPTLCVVRHIEATGERLIRIGVWAVRRISWERFLSAWQLEDANSFELPRLVTDPCP